MSATKRDSRQTNCKKDKFKTKNICIQSSKCNYETVIRRTTKSTTAFKKTAINLNCKRFANKNIKYEKAINSKTKRMNKDLIFLKDIQQQIPPQQLNHTPHYVKTDTQCIHRCRSHQNYYTASAIRDSLKYSSCKMKIVFTYLIFPVIYTMLLLFSSAEAGCRYEPSRSCEAICRRSTSSIAVNNNYQSTSLATNNVTLKSFFSGDFNCTIRALVLMPDDDWYVASLKRVVPILQVAEQRIRASGFLPSFIDFDWMPQDDKCDSAFATVKAMDGIIKNCSHVIFGPVCDYSLAAVGRIAKYFNSHGTPLITVGGSTYDFEKPKTKCADEFYMLLRTGMLSFESISKLTISVMKRNKWSRSIFFYDADGQRNVAGQHTCYLMMTSLGKQMRNENMTFAQYRITEKLKNRTQEMRREIGNKNSDVFDNHRLANNYKNLVVVDLAPPGNQCALISNLHHEANENLKANGQTSVVNFEISKTPEKSTKFKTFIQLIF